jgi:beta-lactamase class A
LARRSLAEARNVPLINFVGLRSNIRSYASKLNGRIGIYFQYLPTGISVGFREEEPFVSASLLKLPTVMKVYHMMEQGRILKTNQVQLKPEDLDPKFGSLWRLGPGAEITIEAAIAASLTESDNTAHRVLYALSGGRPTDVYEYLDVELTAERGESAIAPRNFAAILRSLYYSAYLSHASSNEVLAYLARGDRNPVLRANVPADIPIAQKIGVRHFDNSSDQTYSHCGIFYVPYRPYVLCIMLVADQKEADRVTRELSAMVYDYVSTR